MISPADRHLPSHLEGSVLQDPLMGTATQICLSNAVVNTSSPLINAFFPAVASCAGHYSHERGKQSSKNEDVKILQLPEEYPQVVTGAA